MGVESPVNYVADFNMAWPTATDPKSQGDDHLRLIKVGVKQSFPGYVGAVLAQGTSTGSSNAYVMTPATAPPTLVAGMGVVMTPNFTNTAAATLNISGLGAKSIKRISGVDVTSGEIVSGQPIFMLYDGTQFVIPFPTYANLAATSFSSVLPAQSGNGGKFITTNGSAASWDWDGFKGRTSTTTGAYTFGGSDNFARAKLLSFTDGGSITIPAASTSGASGSKYNFWVENAHASLTLTLNRNGGDTINGATSLKIAPGEVWRLIGDGTNAYNAYLVTPVVDAPQVIAEEQYTSGTAPTSGTNGSYNTRNVNTLVNTVTGVSLASGALTLPAGKWHITFECTAAGSSGTGAAKLVNQTDSSDVGFTQPAYWSGTNSSQVWLRGEAKVTITSAKAFAISHYLNGTAFGFAASAGQTEVFARITARRLGGA